MFANLPAASVILFLVAIGLLIASGYTRLNKYKTTVNQIFGKNIFASTTWTNEKVHKAIVGLLIAGLVISAVAFVSTLSSKGMTVCISSTILMYVGWLLILISTILLNVDWHTQNEARKKAKQPPLQKGPAFAYNIAGIVILTVATVLATIKTDVTCTLQRQAKLMYGSIIDYE
jgi:hypothetical protein